MEDVALVLVKTTDIEGLAARLASAEVEVMGVVPVDPQLWLEQGIEIADAALGSKLHDPVYLDAPKRWPGIANFWAFISDLIRPWWEAQLAAVEGPRPSGSTEMRYGGEW